MPDDPGAGARYAVVYRCALQAFGRPDGTLDVDRYTVGDLLDALFYAGSDPVSPKAGDPAMIGYRLGVLKAAAVVAADQLAVAIEAACPGPHAYVQHRDRRPAWCHACRRTADGVLIPERSAP